MSVVRVLVLSLGIYGWFLSFVMSLFIYFVRYLFGRSFGRSLCSDFVRSFVPYASRSFFLYCAMPFFLPLCILVGSLSMYVGRHVVILHGVISFGMYVFPSLFSYGFISFCRGWVICLVVSLVSSLVM